MSSRLSTATVCVIAVLCAMAPMAGAQTSGPGSSGQPGIPGAGLGPGLPAPGTGLGTPGSPNDQSGTGMTADPGSGSIGPGMDVPGAPAHRPRMGLDRPGTEIAEQPGGVSPGTERSESPKPRPWPRAGETPGSRTRQSGQSAADFGASSHVPGTASPLPESFGTGPTGTAGAGAER